mgnify:CR=1 FL=1
MRSANVYFNKDLAGVLTQKSDGAFEFEYLETWLNNPYLPAISLTLPKTNKTYRSLTLFPFFYQLLPEGENKKEICFTKRIDESDDFGILLSVADTDTIGAVTLKRK